MSRRIIIDGRNLVLGRMASFAAKSALLGSPVDIVNCEESVVSGSKEAVFAKYSQRLQRGIPAKGPFFHRRPDMFVRRAIRGMLTYKKGRGKTAFASVKCYIGVPESLKNESCIAIEKADIMKNPSERVVNYVKVRDICRHFGWKG